MDQRQKMDIVETEEEDITNLIDPRSTRFERQKKQRNENNKLAKHKQVQSVQDVENAVSIPGCSVSRQENAFPVQDASN